ncbi:MAG: protein phosphatase CheZ [Candidatus Pacebacteria bacterium]|nr:protein phosphatase CheZ [Candidatus Paceibacterota bacterium]
MKAETTNPVLSEKLRKVAEARNSVIPPEDIKKVAQEIVSSLHGDISLGHIQLYKELAEMAQFIKKARMDIAAVRPNDIPSMHIPSATDELEAVVGATEVATGTILDSCEVISSLVTQLPDEAKAQAQDAVTQIFEACNFQDVTGQRISKVVKTLQLIDTRVTQLLHTFGEINFDNLAMESSNPSASKNTNDIGTELLYGPQMPNEAKLQAEIDAILASLD